MENLPIFLNFSRAVEVLGLVKSRIAKLLRESKNACHLTDTVQSSLRFNFYGDRFILLLGNNSS